MMKERIVIIGAGLSGLALAYLLRKQNIDAIVLEASERPGGRIQTIYGELETPLELGATWFSDLHSNLLELIDELELKKYPQYSKGISIFQTKSFEPPQQFYVPEAESPSYRLAGGTQMIINRLLEEIPLDKILFNNKVIAITESPKELSVKVKGGEKYLADKVIVCIPPHLACSEIGYEPNLQNEVSETFLNVQTWMAGSIKFVLEYSVPFWRRANYSGMLFSHSGVVTEMYDHTNYEEDKFGFTGFLNGAAVNYSRETRKELVLRQLTELLGPEIQNPLSYFDKVWTNEFVSGQNQAIVRPHQNHGHPLLQQSYMGNKLYFAGTETALEYSGYMEGAVISAKRIANLVSN